MRFHFDGRKSERLRANPKRGIGFEEVQELFSHPYYLDQRSDLPEQYRAIGWAGEQLYTVIFEVRADEGKDVSRFFTNKGRMMGPIQRVNVDLASGMLEELDRAAKELNISRQAVIKTLIRQALDQQYLARRSAASVKRR